MKKIENLMNQFNEQEYKNTQISNLLWVIEEYIKEKVEDMGSEPVMCGVKEVMKYAGCCEKQARRILHDPDLAVFDTRKRYYNVFKSDNNRSKFNY